jgi:pre-60S factor REI1
MKRRITSLPPISFRIFSEQVGASNSQLGPRIQAQPEQGRSQEQVDQLPSENEDETDEACLFPDSTQARAKISALQCLFCNNQFNSVDSNIEHMGLLHGLFIPNIERLTDLESFLHYLSSIVVQYQECLYCGLTRPTLEGIQQHMSNKGHCRLNFEREEEILQFWEIDEDETEDRSGGHMQSQRNFDHERRLGSGKVVGSRKGLPFAQRKRNGIRGEGHEQTTAREIATETKDLGTSNKSHQEDSKSLSRHRASSDRRVETRKVMGITGVSEQQKRALAVVAKKLQKEELAARAAHGWAIEKIANKQKFYRVSDATLLCFVNLPGVGCGTQQTPWVSGNCFAGVDDEIRYEDS